MSEKLITLKETDINKILGSNNIKFDKIKSFFPHLKLISRGDKISYKDFKHEGGKSLFTKEVDNLLINKEIDLAVPNTVLSGAFSNMSSGLN